MFPIAGLVEAELNRQGKGDELAKAEATKRCGSPTRFSPLQAPDERHHPHVIKLIANEAKVEVDKIVDFEMVLCMLSF